VACKKLDRRSKTKEVALPIEKQGKTDDDNDGGENGGDENREEIKGASEDSSLPTAENQKQTKTLHPRFDEVDGLPLAQILAKLKTKLKRPNKRDSKRSKDNTDDKQPDVKKARKLARCQWVSAQLHVPKAAGGRFFFSVKDFGCFDEPSSVEKALSLYFDTMSSGLRVAVQVFNEVAKGAALSPPVPASGRLLMVGNTHLDQIEFCASPIRGANPTRWGKKYSIGQGDLFKGKMNASGFLNEAKRNVIFLPSQADGTAELDVLVKVSSTAVHSVLVNPDHAFEASLLLKRKVPDNVLNEIKSVLYGVVKTDVGLMTVMADLSDEHYKALQPADYKDDLLSLWDAFSELVKNVLLPLAEYVDVIHPDIRPGYDLTANILLKDDSEAKKTMKLIDYESLVSFPNWTAPNTSRYIMREDGKDAITFVWWQCVAMAYFWDAKISILRSPVEESKLGKLKDILLGGKGDPAWLEPFAGMATGTVTMAQVKLTLTELAKVFQNSETQNDNF
jgi:hypothetical protein